MKSNTFPDLQIFEVDYEKGFFNFLFEKGGEMTSSSQKMLSILPLRQCRTKSVLPDLNLAVLVPVNHLVLQVFRKRLQQFNQD